MNQVGTIAVELPESRKSAFLKLLADDDPAVYSNIRQQILSMGPGAAAWLRPHLVSNDPVLRRRSQELVLRFDRAAADDRFLAFCLRTGEGFDLEQGAWLLAQTEYPEINPEAYSAMLDLYASELGQQLKPAPDAREALSRVNTYLFDELGFAGNEESYYDPDNSYLNRVLDRRVGNPISLCALYLLLARRLQMPVTGIGMPGHFICRYQSSAAAIYIDVFNGGKLLTKADCVQYLLRANYSVRDDYLAPVSPRRMLLRICGNLHQIYARLQKSEGATRLQRYLVALAK